MTITVYYQNNPVHLYPAVASTLCLSPGQHLSEAQFHSALHLNAKRWMLLKLRRAG